MNGSAPRGVVPIASASEVDLFAGNKSEHQTQDEICSYSDQEVDKQLQPRTKPTTAIDLIPPIQKKPSCQLTNVVSTCVNKASAHLELLQTLIEEWFDTPEADDYCTGHSSSPGHSSKSPLRGAKSSQAGLSVSGVGMKSASKPAKHDIADELPYLGGMEVIEEVFALIARLEQDRQNNEHDLFEQKQTARRLQRQIESLSIKRAREFPTAVQAEHDAAVEDLNELHWHVTYKLRTEEKLKERVDNANTFNQRINEDISFVQKHCPLVEEKLALEVDAMQKISTAQDETDRELELTLNRLAKTKVRNEEAHTKAGKERENMAKEIEDVGQELQNALTELADARMLYTTYTHQATDMRRQIQENMEEKKVLTVKCENAIMAESMQNKKIDDLTNKIRMVETEHHRLEEDAFNKQQDLDVMTTTMESQYKELTLASNHEDDRLRQITLDNENLAVEIDMLTTKIAKFETGISEDEKALRRMTNQIHNTETQMNQMLDEFTRVQLVHTSIRDRLQEEKERIAQIEDALRHTLETLKKQCKDEIHTRGVLKSRITSDGGELVKSQEEAKEQKVHLTKTVEEIEVQLKSVVEKVDKLRDVYQAKQQVLQDLEKEIVLTKEAREKIESEFTETKDELNPHLDKLKQEYSEHQAQILSIMKLTQESLDKFKNIEPVRVNDKNNDITFGVASSGLLMNQAYGKVEDVIAAHNQLEQITSEIDKETDQDSSNLTPVKRFRNIVKERFCKAKVESSGLRQQIGKLTNQMDLMARKKDEMDHSAHILEKSIRQNELAVERLKADLQEYTTQLEAQTALTNNLLSSKEDVLRRTEQRQKEHTALMAERSVSIRENAITFETEVAANRGLAEKYRKLQGEYVDMKSKVMDMFDERNRLEAGIKDLKQLKGLQSRMRRALETYYKFRGLFNTGELARVEAENRISARKVAVLQDNYNKTLDTITTFLHGKMKVLNERKVVQEFHSVAV